MNIISGALGVASSGVMGREKFPWTMQELSRVTPEFSAFSQGSVVTVSEGEGGG